MATRYTSHGKSFSSQATAPVTQLVLSALLFALPGSTAGKSSERADELLPVDCLLPGAVRKLGGRMTYVTQRRPIKTVAVDCEIRGGEYVAYDRADYGTAMTIWLPLADSGDPKAQNYVGEIYEKGLGVDPNYKLAAQWYRKSAEQDYTAAQINLGQLYERGQGVEQSTDVATQWYEKASGLSKKLAKAVSFAVAPPQEGARLELNAKDEQLAQQQKQIQELVQQLDVSASTQQALLKEQEAVAASARALQQQQTTLRQREKTLQQQRDDLRQQLMQSGSQQKAADGELQARLAELSAQKDALLQRERALAAQQAEQQEFSTQLKTQQAANRVDEQEKARVADAQAAIDARETELKQLREELEQRQRSLEQAELKKRAAGTELESRLAEIQQQSDALQSQQKVLAEKQRQQAELDAELELKSIEVQQAGRELAKLKEAIASSRKSLSALSEASIQVASSLPVIQLIEPQVLRTRGDNANVPAREDIEQRTVIGQVESAAGLMELLINEERVGVDADGFFQKSVPIKSSVTPVSIIAIDKKGKRADLSFNFERKAPAVEPEGQRASEVQIVKGPKIPKLDYGNYHALVIGNKQYRSLPSLRTSVNDTNAVSEILEKQYGFKVRKIIDATRYDILSALNEMRADLTEDDNLLVYYAGHGTLDEVNNRGHWMPVDAEENSTANWISNIAITDIINAMNARKVLIVSDSCYSGAMTRSALARLDAGRSEQTWISWLKMLTEKRSRLSLSSGGLAPVLDGGGGEHSVFARAFLDVLQQNDTVIEGTQLHGKVAELVSYAASAAQFEQVPQYAPIKYGGHEAGDFLFVPSVNL